VKVHVHHILEKLGSKSRLEAALKGRETVATTVSGGKERA
jgi:DNA-binding NarL/FixJ family response regulator